MKIIKNVCEKFRAHFLMSRVLRRCEPFNYVTSFHDFCRVQWSLHPLRFPRYRGTETAIQTSLMALTAPKIFHFQFSARPEGTLSQSEATERIFNFQILVLNSQFLLITLPLEYQSGALLERYCEEHSSGFDNLNH